MRIACAFLVLMALTSAAVSKPDELSELNRLILNDPENVELNLRYARLAEQKGDLRKALAAYERVMVNTPSNEEAQWGFRRITRKLTPDSTNLTLELGGGWESNPARVSTHTQADWLALARAEVRDERRIADIPWRSVASAYGEFFKEQSSELNYFSGGALTGPIWDVTPQFALHSALGGGASYYAGHTLQQEAVAAFTLDSGFWNGAQTGRLRVGFRRYSEFYGGSDGVYVDFSERLAYFGVLQKNDAVVAMPWFRWSNIEGAATAVHVPFEETQPGRYWELGIRGEYIRPLTEWMVVAASFAVSYRDYADVTLLGNGTPVMRRDWFFVPGLSFIFPKALGPADLRVDYRYEDNRSNVAFDTYVDHQITTSVVLRF